MKKLIGAALPILAMSAMSLTARAADPYQTPRVFWDTTTETVVFANGGYSRLIPLADGRLMACCENNGIDIAFSSDNGATWSAPVKIVTNPQGISECVPDLIQLADGTIVVGYNPRPRTPYSADRKFGIRCKRSTDNGRTWSDEIFINDADQTFENGCWEPNFLQLPSGELQCYFADEGPYTSSAEQQISVCRSFDGGAAWGAPECVSFRPKCRDGMPSSVLLPGLNEIAVIIEDNGWYGNGDFTPTIVRCPISTNWNNYHVAGSEDANRNAIFSTLPGCNMAAPYLRVLADGTTVASCQGLYNRANNKLDMFVAVGGKDARDFKAISRPFALDANTEAYWNSLAVIDGGQTIAAVAGINGKIRMIKGKAIKSVSVRKSDSVEVDGLVGGSEAYSAPGRCLLPMGHICKNAASVDFAYDDHYLYFTATMADADVNAADKVTLLLDPANLCETKPVAGLHLFGFAADGTLTCKVGKTRAWVTDKDTEGIQYKVVAGASGYTLEAALPWSKFGLDSAPKTTMRFAVELTDSDGSTTVTETFDDAVTNRSATWMEMTLEGESAPTTSQKFFVDFGDAQNGRGELTQGPDANGNYWNNVYGYFATTANIGNYAYPGRPVAIVNSANQPTGFSLELNTRFMNNGMSAGGNTNPSAELLGELAVATATEDYLFVEDFQDYSYFTISGLDPAKAYVFHAYGCRANDGVRITRYHIRGRNEWAVNHQTSGSGIGSDGWNGNNNNVAVSDPIFPDENGCISFTLIRVQGMLHINALMVEELEGAVCQEPVYEPVQSFLVDIGESPAHRNHGYLTEGADSNGNYWNNLASDNGDNISAGRTLKLVNTDNAATDVLLTNPQNLKTNGSSDAGGLMNPSVANLGELAVASATGDYVYVPTDKKSVSLVFSNLNPKHFYRVKAFGSRATTDSDRRNGWYRVSGSDNWQWRYDFSGTDIGGHTIHGNLRNVAVSPYMLPDADGKITFTVERINGMSHLNLLKLEEYTSDGNLPQYTFGGAKIAGSAVEGGSVTLSRNSAPMTGANVYEAYLELSPGQYTFTGVTTDGEEVAFGLGEDGKYQPGASGSAQVDAETVARVRFNPVTGVAEVLNIASCQLKGSVISQPAALEYAGNGKWQGEVTLDRYPSDSQYLDRYIYFTFNGDESLAIKRISGSTDRAGLASDGYNVENLRMNPGTYTFTLDMTQGKMTVDSEINDFRISLFGSSVCNGQGANGFRGYGYMYGEQLAERFNKGLSANPFAVSGVAIGGNTTTALLNRHDDLDRDFGRYVIIGLSMGNEGIHGASNPEAVFNGFRDNMLRIISDIRADGKVPVVMNNYTRGDYNATDYDYIKRINLLIHQWDVPSVNTLGAIDDGAGHWASGYIADSAHPNTSGHREFMYAMVPSLFDALASGCAMPQRESTEGVALDNGSTIGFQGEGTVHSFTMALRLKGGQAGKIVDVKLARGNATVAVDEAGHLSFTQNSKTIVSDDAPLADGEWHDVVLTSYYPRNFTALYVDGKLVGSVSSRIVPMGFAIGDESDAAVARQYSELTFWRAGMTPEEIAAHTEGKMLQSSLELYVPLSMGSDGEVVADNKAQSLNAVSCNIKQSAIESVEADPDSQLTVTALAGAIAVKAGQPTPCTLTDAAGRVLANRTIVGEYTFAPLAAGFYILNRHKLIVK